MQIQLLLRGPFHNFCSTGKETEAKRSEVFKPAEGMAGWVWGRVLCIYNRGPDPGILDGIQSVSLERRQSASTRCHFVVIYLNVPRC